MATDIQFSYPQQVVTIAKVLLLQGMDPPTLEIVGTDFSAVEEVRLNDITSPLVTVQSRTVLHAVIPKEVRNNAIINVVVVSYTIVYSPKSVVSFQMGRTNRKASGIARAVQLFLKVLLTEPGSDIFSPTLGGGALRGLGRTFSKEAAGGIVGDFVIAVDNTVKQVVTMQSRKPRLPRDERLLSAQVTSARFDASQTALVVSVLLLTQAGSAATANIVL
jgi:hypothetical protein